MTPTTDPTIFIESTNTATSTIIYQTIDGERWEITGVCIACGKCEVGANDIYYETDPNNGKVEVMKRYQVWTGNPVGSANACHDVRFGNRLDIPVRPEIKNSILECSLSGSYLPGVK